MSVAVICTKEADLAHFRQFLHRRSTVDKEIDGFSMTVGMLSETNVVLVVSGAGAVNAARCATLVMTHVRPAPRLVVNFGLARAHDPTLHEGDLVVGDRLLPMDSLFIDAEGAVEHHGVAMSARSDPIRAWPTDEALTPMLVFQAEGVAARFGTRCCRGAIYSSDAVRESLDVIAQLHTACDTLCEDSECAAIAQVVSMHPSTASMLCVKEIGSRATDFCGGLAAAEAVARLLSYWVEGRLDQKKE